MIRPLSSLADALMRLCWLALFVAAAPLATALFLIVLPVALVLRQPELRQGAQA